MCTSFNFTASWKKPRSKSILKKKNQRPVFREGASLYKFTNRDFAILRLEPLTSLIAWSGRRLLGNRVRGRQAGSFHLNSAAGGVLASC